MLKQCPAYLNFNLEQHIVLRAEFLKAVGIEPLKYGLNFFLFSSQREFVQKSNYCIDFFQKFKTAYFEKMRKVKEMNMEKLTTEAEHNSILSKQSTSANKENNNIHDIINPESMSKTKNSNPGRSGEIKKLPVLASRDANFVTLFDSDNDSQANDFAILLDLSEN